MMEKLICTIQEELRRNGFDLCHPIHTSWYNDIITDEGLVESGTLKELPAPPGTLVHENGNETNCNALLIGNTKIIWPVFLKWLASKIEQKKMENTSCTDEEALEQIASPFDTFVQESIPQALEHCCKRSSGLISYELFWSNGNRQKFTSQEGCDSTANNNDDSAENNNYHCYKDEEHSFLVSMQRVATTTGKYWHDNDATKLCVHPEYGTWTAFRTVVVFETSDSSCSVVTPAPPLCPCPVTEEEIKMAKTVFDYALSMSSSDEQGYGATLNKSWAELCEYLHGTVCSGTKWDNVPDTMKPWIQLRDCFGAGKKNWKYEQAQLLYHYTKDPEILSMELDRITKAS